MQNVYRIIKRSTDNPEKAADCNKQGIYSVFYDYLGGLRLPHLACWVVTLNRISG